MQILVLVKPAPDPETRLRPDSAGTGLELDGVKWILGGYDESAVEQALLLKENVSGSTVRALSFSPAPGGEEILRSALALGCDAATWIERPASVPVDPLRSARVLSAAVKRYPHDLVLVGKQAMDDESGVVGCALGEFLGLPDYGAVVDLRWDAGTSRFRFARAAEGGFERVEAGPPVVLALQQAWNDPRTAKLQNILKSRRQPIDKIAWSEVEREAGPGDLVARPAGFRLPAPRAGAKMIDYKTPEEAAEKLVRLLREEARVLP
jgi:electron transfer flavoprotein beta subunit